jgi:cytochrome c
MRVFWLRTLLLLTVASNSHADCDRTHGAEVFQKCAVCHSLKPGEQLMGPSLGNLSGRAAGTLQGFSFSSALLNSHIVWNAATLERFIADPQSDIPGTVMPYRGVKDPTERAALVCYLLSHE